MQVCNPHHHPLLFLPLPPCKTKTQTLFLIPSKSQNPTKGLSPFIRPLFLTGKQRLFSCKFAGKASKSDEIPVDEEFLKKYAPKDKESEDEARRRNWIERGWAPWEELLSPEAYFARKSLNEGEEVPLQSPEAIEAFKLLSPKYRKKKMEESGLSEEEFAVKQFQIKGEVPEPLVTTWGGRLVLTHVPPRDWPPRDWMVDEKELAFIREAHKLQSVRVNVEEMESPRRDVEDFCMDRYKVFLKQYKEWVVENRERLEEESYKVCS